MAVMTKAMGAFLILMVFGMQYFVPDMTAEQISKIIQESLQRAKSDLSKIEQNLDKSGTGASNSQTQAAIGDVLKRLDDAAADIERLRIRLDQAIAQLRHSEEERTRLSAENDQLKADLAKAQALIQSLQAQMAALTAERDKLKAQLQSLDQARQDLAQAANALRRGDVTKEELEAIRKQVEAAQAAMEKEAAEIADLRAQLAAAKDTIAKLQDENAALKKTAEDAKAALDAALARVTAAEASVSDLRAKLADAQDETKKLQDENAVQASQVKDLTAERDNLTKQNNQLASEVDDLSRISFQVIYNQDCGDAKLSIVLSTLPATAQGESPTIPTDASKQWSKFAKGTNGTLEAVYSFGYYSEIGEDNFPHYTLWEVKRPEDGEKFLVYIYPYNIIDSDKPNCSGNLRVSSNKQYIVSPFNTDFGKYNANGPFLFVYDYKSGLREMAIKDEENTYFSSLFNGAECRALACDVHGAAHRKELHELLSNRHGADLTATSGIDTSEKTAASTMLDSLIESFGDRKIKQADLERWVSLLKTAAFSKDKPVADSSHALSPAEIAVMDERLRDAGVPQIVIDRFKARALAGWWTKEDAQARLTSANVAPISDDLDFALAKKNLSAEPGTFAAVTRPLVQSGTMTLAKGIDWVTLMSAKADPAPGDADAAALARTDDAMRKKGLDQPFIDAVEAAVRAKNVRLEDVDRTVAQTEAAVP